MSHKRIFCISTSHILSDPLWKKAIKSKKLIPLVPKTLVAHLSPSLLKFRTKDGTLQSIQIDQSALKVYKEILCLHLEQLEFEKFSNELEESDYLFCIFEGQKNAVTVILFFTDTQNDPFTKIQKDSPSIRFNSYDLPPSSIQNIDAPEIAKPLYKYFASNDSELFSIEAQSFLSNTHILTHLFAHISSIQSKDSITFLDNIKIISDYLRSWLKQLGKIKKLEKNHSKLWEKYLGESISFVDGGMSRIISLPGVDPMGVRVGIYTVIPGETDLEKREKWNLVPFVIGDVINDKKLLSEWDSEPDVKRLQEAARYILEPLVVIREGMKLSPSVILLHGPLQNKFEVYDEFDPSYIPGVSQDFLSGYGIDENEIKNTFNDIPHSGTGLSFWNSCIPIYGYIAKQIKNSNIPIVGVVERTSSASITSQYLEILVNKNVITESAKRKTLEQIKNLEINDSILFGCVLEPGEYLEPIAVKKNYINRAHVRWRMVIEQYPSVYSSIIKTSPNAFPFRIEINSNWEKEQTEKLMNLIYHTSLLLPNYAFPVGIDIVDKYAKIPDWLSKGVSAQLAATVFKRCMDKGDVSLLTQMRNLLARSPRDFFFRPKP